MDIKSYFQPLIKWWWLVAAAVILASVSTYVLTLRQTPFYQSSATLMVGQTINDPNPAQNKLYLEQQLATIHANKAMRQPLRQATMDALGLTWLPEYYVYALPNSQLIELIVKDTDPVRAQAVAAELAHQMILSSPTNMQGEDQERQEFIREQLDNLQKQILDTQTEIEHLQQELGSLNSARQIDETQNEIGAMTNKLSLLQANYATLLGNTEQGAPNSLSIIEPATFPTEPVDSNRLMTVLMSAVLAFTIAGVGAYAIEFFDPTFRTIAEVTRTLNLPVVGQIASINRHFDPRSYVSDYPLSPIADAFRSVRNSLEHVELDSAMKFIQVCSSDVSEGKTTIAVNLAVTMAKAGKRVILIDGDLRKGSLTWHYKLEDCVGLSDVLVRDEQLASVLYPSPKIQNLSIMPIGKNVDSPSDTLDSIEMKNVLSELKDMADIVIFDSPPAIISDSVILARNVRNVLFVVRLGRSKRDKVKFSIDQFSMAGVNILGLLVNELPINATYYGGNYSKYVSYYHDIPKPASVNGTEKRQEWLKKFFPGGKPRS